jgi:glycosyltransferase involved in cell wall biosynthesis
MPSQSIVAIIILNWNGIRDTLACLDSLSRLEYLNTRVIVVDNGSSDRSVEIIRDLHSWVLLVENGQNLGFAAGNNCGIRLAMSEGADYVLLLNNDTLVARFSGALSWRLRSPYRRNGRAHDLRPHSRISSGLPGAMSTGNEEHGQYRSPRDEASLARNPVRSILSPAARLLSAGM